MVEEPRARIRLATYAALAACAAPVLCVLVLAIFVERPLAVGRTAVGRERRAAVAIRDNVIPFQKWGTRAFTEPYLEKHYARVWYFTQSSADPKKREFLEGLTEALSRFDVVDVYLLAHANAYVAWVRNVDPALCSRIRLVYNTGCGDAAQASAWLSLGADVYVGHPGVSNSPVFYFYFLRRWALGMSVGDATRESNALMERALGVERVWGVSAEDVRAEFENSAAICFGRDDLTIAD